MGDLILLQDIYYPRTFTSAHLEPLVLSIRRNYLKTQIRKSTSINPHQPPSPRMSRELRQCLPLYCSDPSFWQKKISKELQMPERQGAGEGATRGLRVTPKCTQVVARASHCLAGSLPAPYHPRIWKPKLPANQIQQHPEEWTRPLF